MITFPHTMVELHMLGKGIIVSSPNIAVLYNNGQEYFRKPISDVGDRCEWFQFCPRLLFEVIQQYDPAVEERYGMSFSFTHASIPVKCLILERQIVNHILTSDQVDRWWVDEMCMILLDSIMANQYKLNSDKPIKKRKTNRAHELLVIEAQKLMTRRLPENLTLSTIAAELYTSPFHLARVFRQQTGSTMHRYLEQLRLRFALDWLPDYKDDLTTLAQNVGYKSHSHFTHAFHRVFGLPPSKMNYPTALAKFSGYRNP